MLDNLYDDMKFFFENGVQGMFFNSDNQAISFNHLYLQLAYEMNWNPDMTREEYDELTEKLLALNYGDGWMYIEEYIDILQKGQDLENKCWDCWGYGSYDGNYDPAYMMEMSDCTSELIERAVDMAVFADQRMLRDPLRDRILSGMLLILFQGIRRRRRSASQRAPRPLRACDGASCEGRIQSPIPSHGQSST